MTTLRVVVCGATGFIGRNMAEHFASQPQKYQVTGISHRRSPFQHPGVAWRHADLTDQAQADAAIADADIVIQAAATTSGAGDAFARPQIHIADNAVMNSHLLRAAFERKVKQFIFFSCSVMYPSSPKPVAEDDFDANRAIEPKYFGPAWTKLYIERMMEFYSRIGSTRFTIVRHSNIFGPYDKFDLERSHVFGATVTKVMTARDGRIVVWGEGTEARDVLHVSDLVSFVQAAIDRQSVPCRIYNVGSGKAVAVRELVAAIVAASGRPLRIEHDLAKPTIKTSVSLDCSRAGAELEWRPRMSLDEGIRHTLDWYRGTYGEKGPDAPTGGAG